MLLKDALGGNCKTKALVTLHPSDSSSLSTVLRTAGQLAQVQNYPVINDFMAKVCVLCENLSFWFEVVRSEARMCKSTGAKSNGTVLSSHSE